jgi:hypothetical protein
VAEPPPPAVAAAAAQAAELLQLLQQLSTVAVDPATPNQGPGPARTGVHQEQHLTVLQQLALLAGSTAVLPGAHTAHTRSSSSSGGGSGSGHCQKRPPTKGRGRSSSSSKRRSRRNVFK